MSIFLKLLGWTGLPQWAIELAVVVVVAGGLVFYGAHHEKVRIETKVQKQIVQVEKRVIETDHTHDQELADLRAYRAANPNSVRLCVAGNNLSARPAEGQPGAAAGTVQPVSPGDSSSGTEQGPDIFPLLDLLAARADEVSALLRRRQEIDP